MRVALGDEEALDADGARPAHPGQVVATEIHEHDVLGAILLRGEQTLLVALAGLRRAGDRVDAGARPLELHERLRRGADQRQVAELEQEEVGRGIDPPQRPVDRHGRRRRGPLRPLRENDLEGVAGADVLLGREDGPLVVLPREEAPDRTARVPAAARGAPPAGLRAVRRPRRRRRRAPPPPRPGGRSGRACARRRRGSPGSRARPRAAERSARASRRGRSRGSPPPGRLPRPRARRPRTRAAGRPSRGGCSGRGAPARPTRAGSSARRRAGADTRRAG